MRPSLVPPLGENDVELIGKRVIAAEQLLHQCVVKLVATVPITRFELVPLLHVIQ